MRRLPGRAGEAAGWAARARRTATALGRQLWRDELGMFASFDRRAGAPLALRVVGGLTPLYLRFSSSSAVNVTDATLHRGALLETLRSPSFNTPFPVPTFDTASANFSRRDYWRGPTWMNVDWLLVRATSTSPTTPAVV